MKRWFWGIAALLWAAGVYAQQEFKIGVVASLSGGFAAAAKDTIHVASQYAVAMKPLR